MSNLVISESIFQEFAKLSPSDKTKVQAEADRFAPHSFIRKMRRKTQEDTDEVVQQAIKKIKFPKSPPKNPELRARRAEAEAHPQENPNPSRRGPKCTAFGAQIAPIQLPSIVGASR